jgi:hypothetical protein
MNNNIRRLLREELMVEISSSDAWDKFYSDEQKFPILKGDVSLYDAIEGLYPKKNNQHNRNYFMWIYNLFGKGILKTEDFYKVSDYLALFEKYKNVIPSDSSDINSIKSLQDLYSVVKDFEGNEDTIATSKKSEIRKIKDTEIDKIFNDEQWLVMIPKTERASCILGKGTQWCTAADESRNMFNSYNSDGPLFVIIDKGSGDKFQMHIESKQLTDAQDREITADNLFDDDEGGSLYYFFEKRLGLKFYDFILNNGIDKYVNGGYSETFNDALYAAKGLPESKEFKNCLAAMRGSNIDEDVIVDGYKLETDPENISKYDVESLLDSTNPYMVNEILSHLEEIGYEIEGSGFDIYMKALNDLEQAKLSLGQEYDIDQGRKLKINFIDAFNAKNPINIGIDNGTSGQVDIDVLKNLVYNRSLFERLIKR